MIQRGKTKKQMVSELLAQSFDHDIIAAMVGCNPTYVKAIAGHYHRPYERSIPVRMVISDWYVDMHGNHTRQLMGT